MQSFNPLIWEPLQYFTIMLHHSQMKAQRHKGTMGRHNGTRVQWG